MNISNDFSINQSYITNLFASSGAWGDKFPEITIRNCALFPELIYYIIKTNSKYTSTINNIESEFNNVIDTSLRDMFIKYGSDKGGGSYWKVYTHYLEKCKNSNITLLEIGLGTNNPNLVSTMGCGGTNKCGGSLRAFNEYLGNARIIGADIDRECLFNENNISTYYVDQLDFKTYENIGHHKYDIIIDDGLHSISANLTTILFGLSHINKNGLIIIEDILKSKLFIYETIDYIISTIGTYRTKIVTYGDGDFMYIIESIN
jgi:hypothetical protein